MYHTIFHVRLILFHHLISVVKSEIFTSPPPHVDPPYSAANNSLEISLIKQRQPPQQYYNLFTTAVVGAPKCVASSVI